VQVTTSTDSWLISSSYLENCIYPYRVETSAYKNLYEWPRPLGALWNQFWKLTLSNLFIIFQKLQRNHLAVASVVMLIKFFYLRHSYGTSCWYWHWCYVYSWLCLIVRLRMGYDLSPQLGDIARVWGTEVPSRVQGQSHGRGSRGPPEAEAVGNWTYVIATSAWNKDNWTWCVK